MVIFDDERHLRAHWVSFSALRFSGVALDGYMHIGYGLFPFSNRISCCLWQCGIGPVVYVKLRAHDGHFSISFWLVLLAADVIIYDRNLFVFLALIAPYSDQRILRRLARFERQEGCGVSIRE